MGHLADELRRVEDAGADEIHLDVMDGNFVPNISLGPAIVELAREHLTIPLNVHLMLDHPDQYLNTFIDAGATTLLIHIESERDVAESLVRIRELGAKPGITLNPGTSPRMLVPVISLVDEVLCMTVRPGYGGQAFMPDVLPSVAAVRRMADAAGNESMELMVDGGINIETAVACARHGANAFVAGTFLFASDHMDELIESMRSAVRQAYGTES